VVACHSDKNRKKPLSKLYWKQLIAITFG
jgi:hypothetical protein